MMILLWDFTTLILSDVSKMVWSVLIFETVMNSVRPIGEFSYPDFPVGAVINWRNASIAFLGNLFLVNFSFCWCLIDGIASAYLQSSLVWRRVAILACGVFDTIEIYSATIKKMSIGIGSSVFLICENLSILQDKNSFDRKLKLVV